MCCTLPFGALLASLPSSSFDGRPRSDCKPYRLAYVIPLPIFCGSAGSLDLMGVRDVFVIYERVGVMYGNKDADDAKKQPHYSGPIDNNHRIAGWRETDKSGKKYLSLKRSEKYTPQPVDNVSRETVDTNPTPIVDDIPF